MGVCCMWMLGMGVCPQFLVKKAVFESVLAQIVLTLPGGSVVIGGCPGCDWSLRMLEAWVCRQLL